MNKKSYKVAEWWQGYFVNSKSSKMSEEKPPYKAAYLQCPADKLLSKKWFVCFWIWSKTQKKLFRKRICISGKTVEEREKLAFEIIEEMNLRLSEGLVIDKIQKKKPLLAKNLTIKEAISGFLEMKTKTLKRKSAETYKSNAVTFEVWIQKQDIENSQSFIAERLQITKQSVNAWFTKGTVPSKIIFLLLCGVLSVSSDELLYEKKTWGKWCQKPNY